MKKLLPGNDYVLIALKPEIKVEKKSLLHGMPGEETPSSPVAVVRGIIKSSSHEVPMTSGRVIWFEMFNAKKIPMIGASVYALDPEHIIAFEEE